MNKKQEIDYGFSFAEIAAKRSGDTSTKVGAVFVHFVPGGGMTISKGACNDLPEGVQDVPERRERPEKYAWVHHAESKLIAQAARQGVKTAGAVVFVTHHPCSACCKVLIDAGISEIYYDVGMFVGGQWAEEANRARIMCEEAEVQLISRYADESA